MSAQIRLPWIAPSCREAFARRAAPESIEVHLAARRAERDALDQHITWLEGLLTQRQEAQR